MIITSKTESQKEHALFHLEDTFVTMSSLERIEMQSEFMEALQLSLEI